MIGLGVTNARPAPRTRDRLFERFALASRAVRGPVDPIEPRSGRSLGRGAIRTRGEPTGVEYSVRPARITDVDRVMALSGVQSAAGDLLRQLVYLPHASVIVAEARREIVGAAILAIRPSIQAGGFVGVLDLLAVGAAHDADRVTELLLEEVVRSARNKGCAAVQAPQPSEPTERARWERLGFHDAGPQMEREVEPAGAAGRPAR